MRRCVFLCIHIYITNKFKEIKSVMLHTLIDRHKTILLNHFSIRLSFIERELIKIIYITISEYRRIIYVQNVKSTTLLLVFGVSVISSKYGRDNLNFWGVTLVMVAKYDLRAKLRRVLCLNTNYNVKINWRCLPYWDHVMQHKQTLAIW